MSRLKNPTWKSCEWLFRSCADWKLLEAPFLYILTDRNLSKSLECWNFYVVKIAGNVFHVYAKWRRYTSTHWPQEISIFPGRWKWLFDSPRKSKLVQIYKILVSRKFQSLSWNILKVMNRKLKAIRKPLSRMPLENKYLKIIVLFASRNIRLKFSHVLKFFQMNWSFLWLIFMLSSLLSSCWIFVALSGTGPELFDNFMRFNFGLYDQQLTYYQVTSLHCDT